MSQKVKLFQRKVILNNKLYFFLLNSIVQYDNECVFKKYFNLCTLRRLFYKCESLKPKNLYLKLAKAEYHCHIQYSFYS